MAVQIKPNKPEIRKAEEGLKLFLYGKPNIGKTTLASSFPNTLILNTDGNLDRFSTPAYSIKSWRYSVKLTKLGIKPEECFVDVIESILEGDHDFNTIAIEIGSHIYDMCRNYIIDRENIVHESDLEWGKGHSLIKSEWQKVMLLIFTSKYNILFITHEKDKEIKDRAKSFTVTVPDLSDNVAKLISGLCSITCHFTILEDYVDGKKVLERVLRLQPENEADPVGNKINIKTDYLKLEEGYEYEDLVDLVKSTKDTNLKIKESRK